MPNSFFQFKQFRVDQGRSSMKVTTEGCLLGALVALEGDEKTILDIGTGTGLLALMIAQRTSANIEAVELASEAAEQAADNFKNSPWKDRLKVWEGAIQDYAVKADRNYDLIVANPPFFKGHLKSGKAKDQAIHNDELSFDDLAHAVAKLLNEQGHFWVIYPAFEFDQFVMIAKAQNLILQNQFEIYDRPGRLIFRKIGVFGFDEITNPKPETIHIKEVDGAYSPRFLELIEDYYL